MKLKSLSLEEFKMLKEYIEDYLITNTHKEKHFPLLPEICKKMILETPILIKLSEEEFTSLITFVAWVASLDIKSDMDKFDVIFKKLCKKFRRIYKTEPKWGVK